MVGFDIRPNCSSSGRVNILVFSAISVLVAGVGAFSAWHGAWLVLPFAGLELVFLGAGLIFCRRKLTHKESVWFDTEKVTVKNACSTWTFPRAWMRVVLLPGASRNYPSRLFLTSHGRRVEVGSFLHESERRNLAAQLRAASLQSIRSSADLPHSKRLCS